MIIISIESIDGAFYLKEYSQYLQDIKQFFTLTLCYSYANNCNPVFYCTKYIFNPKFMFIATNEDLIIALEKECDRI